jgi:hypothetical protein
MQVILRTINPLQSAFVSISLSKTFFDGLRVKNAEGAKPISCQISLKVRSFTRQQLNRD